MRRYLSSQALGLGLVAAVLMAAMVVLGLWQLGAYDERQARDAEAQIERQPVPLDDVMGPDEAFPSGGVGRPVSLTGTFLADEQLYLRGVPGAVDRYAVVTPLLMENGSAVLVVRGSTDEPSADVPSGDIELTGLLEPSMADGTGVDDRGVADGLRISALVEAVRVDLYGGYVVATDTEARRGLSPVTLTAPEPSRWAGIRNLLYAFQWWIFAGFVAFMWWRIVGDLATAAADSDRLG